MASKRRSFISLIFIINCITKCSLIRKKFTSENSSFVQSNTRTTNFTVNKNRTAISNHAESLQFGDKRQVYSSCLSTLRCCLLKNKKIKHCKENKTKRRFIDGFFFFFFFIFKQKEKRTKHGTRKTEIPPGELND